MAKIENGVTTIYFGDYEKNLTTNEITKYYSFGGKKVAVKDNTGIRFLYSDQLNSTQMVLDADGSKHQVSYFPYGQIRQQTGLLPSRLYTGQIADQQTGLYFYNSRYYNPATGMFITPDTINDFGNMGNRYGYVGANPLSRNDPTGHFFNLVVGAAGAAAGAIFGGVSTAVIQKVTTGKVNWGQVAANATQGFVTSGCLGASGGTAAVVCGTLGQAAGKFVLGTVAQATADLIVQNLDPQKEQKSVADIATNAVFANTSNVISGVTSNITSGLSGGMMGILTQKGGELMGVFMAGTAVNTVKYMSEYGGDLSYINDAVAEGSADTLSSIAGVGMGAAGAQKILMAMTGQLAIDMTHAAIAAPEQSVNQDILNNSTKDINRAFNKGWGSILKNWRNSLEEMGIIVKKCGVN